MQLPIPAAVLAFALVPTAAAQTAPPTWSNADYAFDSGEHFNRVDRREVVLSFTVRFDGAGWLRLYFDEVQLAGSSRRDAGAVLRLTSWQDGDVQELDARGVEQWSNSSAYFNGDAVQVEVVAPSGAEASRVRLRSVDVGGPGVDPTASQCGLTDDRNLWTDQRAARLLPVGCTGWLIDDCGGCFLTAGHCTGSLSVVQFNVPLSTASGGLRHPPASDQYSVDNSSLQSNGGQGVGDDWGYFGAFANNQTGLTPAAAQGSVYTLGAPPSSVGNNDARITGYGTDNTPPEHNQVQQTHVGPMASLVGTQIGYVTDTTGGNSGSPVIWEQTGEAVGIHTHGGCNAVRGNNWGTKSTHPGLQAALANPKGVCANRGTCGELGTAFCDPAVDNSTGDPGTIRAEGSAQVSQNDVTLIAEQLPPDKNGYFLTAPTQDFIQNPGGSQGHLCLGGTVGRYASSIQSSGPGGTFSLQIDLTDLPPGSQVVQPGETHNFQAWHRDKNPGKTSNFTHAIEIEFE